MPKQMSIILLFFTTLLLQGCGRLNSSQDDHGLSPLADMDAFVAFDTPCSLRTAQPNLTQPIVVNYLCKGAFSQADQSSIYFELSPVDFAPAEMAAPWESGELQLLQQTSMFAEFVGYTKTKHLRVTVRLHRGVNPAPALIFLEPSTVPFDLQASIPPTEESCNGPAVFAPHTVRLPFQVGRLIKITQADNGPFSHQNQFDEERHCLHHYYAFDFAASTGTAIYAAEGGTVAKIKEDSTHGCPNPSCANDANYIAIKHTDGTTSLYYHLQNQGALVHVNQVVRRGDLIGRTGNTGFSSGPHLHFEIRTADNRYSLASYFRSAEKPNGALLVAGATYTVISGEE